jgi:hypothetical protein
VSPLAAAPPPATAQAAAAAAAVIIGTGMARPEACLLHHDLFAPQKLSVDTVRD